MVEKTYKTAKKNPTITTHLECDNAVATLNVTTTNAGKNNMTWSKSDFTSPFVTNNRNLYYITLDKFYADKLMNTNVSFNFGCLTLSDDPKLFTNKYYQDSTIYDLSKGFWDTDHKCSICLNKVPKTIDIATNKDCSHIFCKQCWIETMDNLNDNNSTKRKCYMNQLKTYGVCPACKEQREWRSEKTGKLCFMGVKIYGIHIRQQHSYGPILYRNCVTDENLWYMLCQTTKAKIDGCPDLPRPKKIQQQELDKILKNYSEFNEKKFLCTSCNTRCKSANLVTSDQCHRHNDVCVTCYVTKMNDKGLFGCPHKTCGIVGRYKYYKTGIYVNKTKEEMEKDDKMEQKKPIFKRNT